MKHHILITAIALALIAGVTVRADDKPAKACPSKRPHMEGLLPSPVLEKLKLTDDQKAKYDVLAADFKKEHQAFRTAHPDLMEKMKAAHEASDKEKMKALREEMKPMWELRKSCMEKVMALLTDDQKAEMKKGHEQRERKGCAKPAGTPSPQQ